MTAVAVMAIPAHANPKIVVDVASGRVIEHEDAFRKWYPASLTKLMTAYTTFSALRAGELSTESIVTMSQKAAAAPPSKSYFKPGSKMTLDSALKILLVKSANDIAVAVGETVSGSLDAFVARMNADAARLGMTSSHFINPNGLPGPGQYSTARDLAILAVAIRREFPQYAGYFSLEGITTGKKQYPNYNLLIGRFDGADGMKTGFICASGFNQVSSATRNGRTVVSVVLGTDSLGARADVSADLLQKALTTGSAGGTPLRQLAPYGDRNSVADISSEICNPKSAKIRSEGRDEEGRMIMHSAYIHDMGRPPIVSFAGLLPGSEQAAQTSAKPGDSGIANVPIPIPRPTF
ncbi:MAG: D-alanyl-D-alanine carboxypeptidase family protein [Allorhizobium sp.]